MEIRWQWAAHKITVMLFIVEWDATDLEHKVVFDLCFCSVLLYLNREIL